MKLTTITATSTEVIFLENSNLVANEKKPIKPRTKEKINNPSDVSPSSNKKNRHTLKMSIHY
jgi:hypothetical protein